MAKYIPKFKIGDWVVCEHFVISEYTDQRRTQRKLKKSRVKRFSSDNFGPIVGQICGAIYRYEGVRDPGSCDEPPYFTANKAFLLWQIKTALTTKPLEAFEGDIVLTNNHPDTLPFRAPGSKWTDQEKESLRQDMKNWPRDEKGRFKSYIEATAEERNKYNGSSSSSNQ